MARKPPLEVVSFDLDGTLLEGTVFEAVARGAGFLEELEEYDRQFREGRLSLEETFWVEYRYLVGLPLKDVERWLEAAPWLSGIPETVETLREHGHRVVVLTDNPSYMAEFPTRWGFQHAIASPAAVVDGRITETVKPAFDKLENFRAWCDAQGISITRCAHVGNDFNDIPIFQAVGRSVAVNPTTPEVARAAQHALRDVRDLRVTLPALGYAP